MSAVVVPVVFCVLTSGAMTWRAVIAGIAASALLIFNYSGLSAGWFYDGGFYALALLFAVAGSAFWLRDDWRLKIAATALIILAYPVNISLAVSAACFASVLLVLFPVLFWSHRYPIAVHAVAVFLALLHAQWFGVTTDFPTARGIMLSLSGLGQSVANIYGDTGIIMWVWAVGIAILAYRWLFGAPSDVDRIWTALVIGGLAAIIASSQLMHVAGNANEYVSRYFLIPVSVITMVSVLVIVDQMWSCLLPAVPWTRYLAFLGTGAILASI
jgi:hypothetical protein